MDSTEPNDDIQKSANKQSAENKIGNGDAFANKRGMDDDVGSISSFRSTTESVLTQNEQGEEEEETVCQCKCFCTYLECMYGRRLIVASFLYICALSCSL